MIRLAAKPVTLAMEVALRGRIEAVARVRKHPPKLAVVLVGEDAASVIYTRMKGEKAIALGMLSETIRLPVTSTPADVRKVIDDLNASKEVDGILIQRPLPVGFREEELVYWVAPEKDVDAFHPENAGRLMLGLPCFKPCTPAGIMSLLAHYDIQVSGKVACVIGRSSIVGKPMAAMLLQADATLIQCHSKTTNVCELSSQADVLIVAAGRPGLVDASHVKPGAVVVDVGIHRTSEGKVVGDVNADSVTSVAHALTPVPGGVGPMTIMTLMENTVLAAEQRMRSR